MTHTNLSYPLIKRYAGLSGQIINIERKITEAERVVSTVPELRAEIAKKHDQMVHIAGLLTDIDPTWDPKSVQPIKPHAYNLPFKYGDCTVLAYDILRETGRWMTVKEVVLEIFRREGLEKNLPVYIRTAANVGAGFRRRLRDRELERDVAWRSASAARRSHMHVSWNCAGQVVGRFALVVSSMPPRHSSANARPAVSSREGGRSSVGCGGVRTASESIRSQLGPSLPTGSYRSKAF